MAGGGDGSGGDERFRYLIVRHEKAGMTDLFWYVWTGDKATASKFLESSDDDHELYDVGDMTPDHRWVIFVSIIVRKIIKVFGKPMEWTGYAVEFFLNLLSLNGNLLGLLYNLISGKVVVPRRGSGTFISAIGHLDGRIDLDPSDLFVGEGLGNGAPPAAEKAIIDIGNRSLMDLCMMASKLAYENATVVKNVVNLHWKMHFVDFYNCWNDLEKDNSTQVFIFSDKPEDANLIVVSFRGTEPFDADDWITDFDYSWYEIPKLGKVHMGFLEALGLGSRANTSTFQKHLQAKETKLPSNGTAGVSEKVSSDDSDEDHSQDSQKKLVPEMIEMSAYHAVKSKLKSLLEEHKNAKFIVTGHSLGGALALLFPTVLVLHEQEELLQHLLGVHTFGQPRVGNEQLCKFMESHLEQPIPKYYRVVYCNDLVPRLPYDDKTFLYKHFGFCLYYNSFFTEKKVDEEPNRNYFGMKYLIPEYLNAIWELLRGLTMGYTHGPEYKESWEGIFLRVIGLVVPGLSAHGPTNYIDSIRLGRERKIQMSAS